MSPTHTNSTHVSPSPAPRSTTSRVAAVGARRDERMKKTGTSMVRYEVRTTIDRPIGDVFARLADLRWLRNMDAPYGHVPPVRPDL